LQRETTTQGPSKQTTQIRPKYIMSLGNPYPGKPSDYLASEHNYTITQSEDNQQQARKILEVSPITAPQNSFHYDIEKGWILIEWSKPRKETAQQAGTRQQFGTNSILQSYSDKPARKFASDPALCKNNWWVTEPRQAYPTTAGPSNQTVPRPVKATNIATTADMEAMDTVRRQGGKPDQPDDIPWHPITIEEFF